MAPIEHTLTKAEAIYVKESAEQEKQLVAAVYAALGRAREAETTLESIRFSRDQQLSIISKNAGLPAGKARLSADGLSLIIEPNEA